MVKKSPRDLRTGVSGNRAPCSGRGNRPPVQRSFHSRFSNQGSLVIVAACPHLRQAHRIWGSVLNTAKSRTVIVSVKLCPRLTLRKALHQALQVDMYIFLGMRIWDPELQESHKPGHTDPLSLSIFTPQLFRIQTWYFFAGSSAGVDSVAIVLAHARSKVEGCFLQACTG
ncbi:hypothetical protein WJX79_009406 [Trebouxia sp. C0005]